MTTTIREAPPAGASDLAAVLEGEPEPLTVAEAQAIVRDYFAGVADPPRVPPVRGIHARACRCDRPWEFERRWCSKCGRDLEDPPGGLRHISGVLARYVAELRKRAA